MRRSLDLIVFVFLTGAFRLADYFYGSPSLHRGYQTFLVLSILYLVFQLILAPIGIHRIKDSKTRYTFRKTVSTIMWGIFLLVAVRIWVEDPQALIVTYGLVGAGVAISLQDLFKNVAGGLILVVTRPYAVGDRIEIGSDAGDVINIGAFHTTLMEIGQWIDGDQATGRLVQVPNGKLLTEPVKNYTFGHDFIWDELFLPIDYAADWKKARDIVMEIAETQTSVASKEATETLSKLQERYYLDPRETEPRVYMRMTDNWISLRLRYVAKSRDRREIHARLSESVLDAFQTARIQLASTTIDITSIPDLRIKKSR